MFCAASSLLGTLDIVQMFMSYYRLDLLLGPDVIAWRRHNPADRVAHLSGVRLLFCTGADAFDLPQNDAFADALRASGKPFQYHVHPGGHDTSFVQRYIEEHFAFHQRCFHQAL
jgi:S-formylglutathione hydrolase FrmB